jgi:pyrimidine-nucleoside phosphorylase
MMRAVDIIRKKRDGHALDRHEVEAFVRAAADGSWPDYQLSALLMAIVLRGMSADETAWLTGFMARSGATLDWSDLPGPAVDKHSTGGVGDKTSLILAPLVAACGAYVPMMSGRGLGHTGGTLDKLESIPGFRVDLSIAHFPAILKRVGMVMIGQTAEVAPADKKLYALRDATSTVESMPLITASILSKKIAEGIQGLVMDVKCGRGAFMKNRADARQLAESIAANGTANGVRTEAMITAMDAPLGRAVGNAVEVQECIDVLKGSGPEDVKNLSIELATRMVRLAGLTKSLEEARANITSALASGRGLEILRNVIEQQGGDPKVIDDPGRLPRAPHNTPLVAERSGYVTHLDAEIIGHAACMLGAGREQASHNVDHAVGFIIPVQIRDKVNRGDVLVEIHYRDETKCERVKEMLRRACVIGDAAPARGELIHEVIE